MPPELTITTLKKVLVFVISGGTDSVCAKAEDEKAATMIIERSASFKNDFNVSVAKFLLSLGRISGPEREDSGEPSTRE